MQPKLFLLQAALAAVLVLGASACTRSYNQVNDGKHGPVSPVQSGQQRANAEIRPPYGDADRAKLDHQVQPIRGAMTNGKTDPTMEGSGNIAAQGNYPDPKKASPH